MICRKGVYNGKPIKEQGSHSVYTESMNNTKGFTLLSALFSLSVLIMIPPLLSMSLKLVQQDPHEYTIDVHHFFIFLRNDIIQATEVESTNHSLTLRLGSKDRKITRLNSSHVSTSYAVLCLNKKN